jgi:flagellar P-ring protein precursor FlgI
MIPAGVRALACVLLFFPAYGAADSVRLKDLGHFLGRRDNALVGYGIVTGLSGSGDSPRSVATRQALSAALSRLGSNVAPEDLQSRNVAAVMVTATLPPEANVGDRIDVTVTSIGDARSLAGGALLMTQLLGPDQRVYALGQGSLAVGGFNFQDAVNLRQKNYPTSGIVAGGATVETAVSANLRDSAGRLTFVLRDPDFVTATRVADCINQELGADIALVRGADSVSIDPRAGDVNRIIARIENASVMPDVAARVVVNERSGTVVAGGGVRISSVVVAQGDVKVSVSVNEQASQPYVVGGFAPNARSLIVTNSRLGVSEGTDAVVTLPDTTVADLVGALNKAKVGIRGTIAILQAIKSAGALHADLIVQ